MLYLYVLYALLYVLYAVLYVLYAQLYLFNTYLYEHLICLGTTLYISTMPRYGGAARFVGYLCVGSDRPTNTGRAQSAFCQF
jgi:hypothetical protein